MKTLHVYVVLSFVLSFQICSGQVYPGANAISAEAFGVGGTASINYERNFFSDRRKRFTTLRIGLGVNTTTQFISIPHGFTMNFQVRKNYLEAGLLGSPALYEGQQSSFYYLAPCVGYRRIDPRTRLFIRFYFTTLIPVVVSPEIVPLLGLGVGYTFK